MSWLGWLVLGVALGWFFEFLIDLFYWRNACHEKEVSLATRERDLEARLKRLTEDERNALAKQADWDTRHRAMLDDLGRREASFSNRDGELKNLEGQVSARQAELDGRHRLASEWDSSLTSKLSEATLIATRLGGREQDLGRQWSELEARSSLLSKRAEELAAREATLTRQHQELDRKVAQTNAALAKLQSVDGELNALRLRSSKLGEIVRQRYQTKAGADDLEVVEGIGPKIAELLHADNIHSFKELALTSVERLRGLLDAAGPRFKLANPGTWPEQAKLLAAGEYVAFEKLRDELMAGIRVDGMGQVSHNSDGADS